MSNDSPRGIFFASKLTNRQKFLAGVGLAVLAGAILLIVRGWGPQATANEDPNENIIPVNVQRVVQIDSFDQVQRYSGIIRARRASELAFENGGLISTVHVEEGDMVCSEQPLAVVDSATLQSRRAATEASLARARAQLAELNAGPRIEKIRVAAANEQAARSRYQIAKFNLERRERLKESGAISKEEYDQALYRSQSALEDLNAASHQLAELQAGSRIEQIDAAEATVNELKAALAEIDVAIAKTTLVAPFDGTITKRYLDVGSVANPGVPVFRLVESQQLEAWIGLPVRIANQFNQQSKVRIMVDEHPIDARFQSRIREIDPTTRTQTVVFALDSDAANAAVAGQICRIEVTRTTQQSGIWVPTTALTSGVRGLWSVMAIEEDDQGNLIAGKRDVSILFNEIDRALVRGTLQSGEQIITDGVHRIVVGQRVELIKTPGPERSEVPERSSIDP